MKLTIGITIGMLIGMLIAGLIIGRVLNSNQLTTIADHTERMADAQSYMCDFIYEVSQRQLIWKKGDFERTLEPLEGGVYDQDRPH